MSAHSRRHSFVLASQEGKKHAFRLSIISLRWDGNDVIFHGAPNDPSTSPIELFSTMLPKVDAGEIPFRVEDAKREHDYGRKDKI